MFFRFSYFEYTIYSLNTSTKTTWIKKGLSPRKAQCSFGKRIKMEHILLSPIRLEDLSNTIEAIVTKAINSKHKEDLSDRMLSPEETCKLFTPHISKATLHNWEQQGRLKKYKMGGRAYYKYSEVMSGLESLKRYKKF